MDKSSSESAEFIGCEIKQTGKLSSLLQRQGSKKRKEKDRGSEYTLQNLRAAVSGSVFLPGCRSQEQESAETDVVKGKWSKGLCGSSGHQYGYCAQNHLEDGERLPDQAETQRLSSGTDR